MEKVVYTFQIKKYRLVEENSGDENNAIFLEAKQNLEINLKKRVFFSKAGNVDSELYERTNLSFYLVFKKSFFFFFLLPFLKKIYFSLSP